VKESSVGEGADPQTTIWVYVGFAIEIPLGLI
jgi:hypothetical protein